jgi:hypothetical protein
MERAEQEVRFLRHVRLLIGSSRELTCAACHHPSNARRASPMQTRRPAASAIVALLLLPIGIGAQLTASKADVPPPEEVAAPIRTLLGPGAKVTTGPATLEFWWVAALAVKGTGPVEWSHVAEGSVIGAVRVSGAFKEIRGKTVKPGVYTLRFGLQPQNGDHLGASSFREHLLLSPAAVDKDAAPLGFEGTIALSKQTIGASHPAALSLDPPVATTAALSPVTNELDHKGIVFEVRTSSGSMLRFGLTLIGVIEH